jgi:hypothetical protein
LAKALATARPMPLVEPVTSATLSFSIDILQTGKVRPTLPRNMATMFDAWVKY